MQQSSSTRTYLILAVQSGLFVINWEQKHTSKIQIWNKSYLILWLIL